jgi:putative hemolysin
VPDLLLEARAYRIRYARTPEDLDAVLRLRYEIFNLELGEGLDESHQTGRDEDGLDGRLHHLMIEDRTGLVVGTYRMQTAEMADRHGGFYSAEEFELESLPREVLDGAVEIGRACVAKDHRNGRVLHLLWRGLAAYLTWNRKHYLFGCCSLTSQDPALGLSVHRHLEAAGAVHPRLCLDPRPEYRCTPVDPTSPVPPPHVPALFQSYLALGAMVCGPPALDRRFKTIDWLVLLDTATIDPAVYQSFFR